VGSKRLHSTGTDAKAKPHAEAIAVGARRASSLPRPLVRPQSSLTAGRALGELIAAIELLEVTRRSLAHQEIGQEQAVIRCALQAMWVTHDYLAELPDASDDTDTDDDDP
jgi:hypothetical protein